MTTITFDDLFAAQPSFAAVDRDWLVDVVLRPLGITADNPFGDVCEDIVVGAADTQTGALELRPGGWRINLGASAIRATVAAAVVGAGLMIAGVDQIPVQLLPAVLPLLVDIERVRLNRQDQEMIIPVRRAAEGVQELAIHPQVLYNRLDSAIQAQLNYGDFLAFTDRLIEVGELDDAGGGDVRARGPHDRPAIRITWR